jgi:hypothetical protein
MPYFKYSTISKPLLYLSGAAIATFMGGCSSILLNDLPSLSGTQQTAIAQESESVLTTSIAIDKSREYGSAGGIIAADVDGDQQLDILVTQPGTITAYSLTKGQLWSQQASLWLTEQSESEGLPGLHAPGIQAGDIDGDGKLEIVYLTSENTLEALDGPSGNRKYQVPLPPVTSLHNHWEHAVIANFSGQGDTELLLQASQETDKAGYVRDNLQAAFKISDLLTDGATAQPLWRTENFVSLSHGPARVVDINGDGRDEVVGATILGADGQILYSADIGNTSFPHIDSLAVDDIVPDRPGLEVVIPEERGAERVILFDERGTIWTSEHRRQTADKDGDKVAIGNFDPQRPGLEMWFRGNESRHFTVLDATGEVIASYRFPRRRPDSWTDKGFEVIHRIRWTGAPKEYIVAKERHEAGDVGIFDALTGELIAQFPGQTQRLYVADVLGDWREEIIVLEAGRIQVYQNQQPNPQAEHPSLWEQPHYRRQKMTWNYYSP